MTFRDKLMVTLCVAFMLQVTCTTGGLFYYLHKQLQVLNSTTWNCPEIRVSLEGLEGLANEPVNEN